MFEEYQIVWTKEAELGRFKIIQHMINVEGETYPYSYIDVKDSVAVLARYKDRYIFIKQYRKTIDKTVLEIPGGAIDVGEMPESAAIRELKEETGYIVESISLLGSFYPTVGVSNEKCYFYYAECKGKDKSRLEPLERISVVQMTADEVEKSIESNDLMHSMALVAWLRYKENQNVNRQN